MVVGNFYFPVRFKCSSAIFIIRRKEQEWGTLNQCKIRNLKTSKATLVNIVRVIQEISISYTSTCIPGLQGWSQDGTHSWENCFIEDQLGLVGKVTTFMLLTAWCQVGGHRRRREPLHLEDTLCCEETRRSGELYKMVPVQDIQW